MQRSIVLAGFISIFNFVNQVVFVDAAQPAAIRVRAPELLGISDWINSKPIQLAELRGEVIVLHFWTFG